MSIKAPAPFPPARRRRALQPASLLTSAQTGGLRSCGDLRLKIVVLERTVIVDSEFGLMTGPPLAFDSLSNVPLFVNNTGRIHSYR